MKSKSIIRLFIGLLLISLLNEALGTKLKQKAAEVSNVTSLTPQSQKIDAKPAVPNKQLHGNTEKTNTSWSISSYFKEINDHVRWDDILQTMKEQKDLILYCI